MKRSKPSVATIGKAAFDPGDKPKKPKLKPVKKEKKRNAFLEDEDDFFPNEEPDPFDADSLMSDEEDEDLY